MAEYNEKEPYPDEKTMGTAEETRITEEEVRVDVHTGLYDGVQRNMKQRHIQMIALAGVCTHVIFRIALISNV